MARMVSKSEYRNQDVNPNVEARNPKQIQMIKTARNIRTERLTLSAFGFRICFELRISDFEFEK